MHFSVRHRMMGTFLLLWLMCAVMGFVVQFTLQERSTTYDDIVKREQRHDLLIAANLDVQNMFWLLQDFQNGKSISAAEIRKLGERASQRLKALEEFSWQAQNTVRLKEAHKELDNLRSQINTAMARSRKMNVQNILPLRRPIIRSLDALHQADTKALWSKWQAMQDAQIRVGSLFAYCLIVVLCGGLGLSIVLSRSITRPIEDIAQATHAISEGDLTTRIPVKSKDEIGELTERFNFMMDQLEGMFIGAVKALATAVDSNSRWTYGHSGRVTDYALDIAQQINLDKRTMSILRISGLLHDVGKVHVPGYILDKDGRLTEEEYKIIKQHPIEGYRIISSVPHLKAMLPGIRNHHERYDGKGYPDGLKGDAIPYLARILAVADAFDAMTSNRPYRPGMPEEKALRIMAEDGGNQWDVNVVDAFMRTRDSSLTKVKRPSDSLELPVPIVAVPDVVNALKVGGTA